MIYAEVSILDLDTRKIKAKYNKSFDIQSDFNAWFKIIKSDTDTIINIMSYNPQETPGLKSVYDARMLRVDRTLPV